MDRHKILLDLQELLQKEIFEDDTLDISELTTASDIEGWDSFEQINVLTAVEEIYGIQFEVSRARTLKNIGELIDYICEECE